MMRIIDVLEINAINLNLQANTKQEVIIELVDILYNAGKLQDKNIFLEAILTRETQFSTGVENGIAIPHAKNTTVLAPAIAFGISRNSIEYGALDGNPTKLFFMIAAPSNANTEYLETLSKLATMLMDNNLKIALLTAKTAQEVIKIIANYEQEKSSNIASTETQQETFELLAVTACPTGIAHTYLAANSLLAKAKELGIALKIETNGSVGVKNKLSVAEINNAKAIIIAADTKVEMERFIGKKVLITTVVNGIKKPEELIKEALTADLAIYNKSSLKTSSGNTSENASFYRHLMNGVSNMLPFVVGGGILIALSFLFGIKASDVNDPSFNVFAKLLMDIGGGGAFTLMIPILAGFIGMSIADRVGFMPAMVGGLMAATTGGGFLGGLIAGFLGGYVVIALKKIFSRIPNSLEGMKPVLLYPVCGLLITGILMHIILMWVVPINKEMTYFLNTLNEGNLIVLGIILGGMMAVDMGGPINKAAFTFGIMAIQAGNLAPHAAVMAGGMVPPLAIALATTLFKNKFSNEERKSGVTNYIMGSSFITEGAIPFAVADPYRILPSCIIGAATAGGLSMLFGVLLPAPHGGLFVIPLVNHPLLYMLAILIGSIISAVLIGFLKKNEIL